MTRGRKPIASEIHRMNGTYKVNPERENKQEPQPKYGRPHPSDKVTGDKVAMEKWEHCCDLLEEMGLLTTSDHDLLEQYCITYSLFSSTLAKVRTTGVVLVRTKGEVSITRNPFTTELQKFMDRMTKLMAELGLTPSSRARLRANPEALVDDAFSAWLDRGSNARN